MANLFPNKFAQLDEVHEVADAAGSDLFSMTTRDCTQYLYKQIDWQEYVRAGSFLSQSEFQLIERCEDSADFVFGSDTSFKQLAGILMNLADKCTSNVSVQQYVFTKMLELLEREYNEKSKASKFTIDGEHIQDGPFLRALRANDAYTQRVAAESFAHLLVVMKGDGATLVYWIIDKLNASVVGSQDVALPSLAVILRSPTYRRVFIDRHGVSCIGNLLTKLGNNAPAQILYDLCFILWTISLEENCDLEGFRVSGICRILPELMSAAPSRKVVRMAASCLNNLATTHDDGILTELLTGGLVRHLENVIHANAHKQSGDPEVEADVRSLFEILMKNYREYSSFERWTVEVQNGTLRWGIVHTDKFWRENAKLMETNDFKYLKMLIALLHSDSPTVVCVALYDLGEFTRFYPNGRGVVKSLGGKDTAMELIASENPDIQRHALQCISKIMVTNWEFMK